MLFINEKTSFIENTQKIKDLLNSIEKEVKLDEFKGIPASPGTVTGKAKIIFNPRGANINKGDILVTSMTNIDFVPLMSKASAIVTDEGGLLSHAAIVSREMKKPCIVGTKISTKVLKDNDLIEVDANKGIVKKIT